MDESVAETLATPIERRELIELLQAQHSVNLAVAGVLIAASKSDGPTEQLGEMIESLKQLQNLLRTTLPGAQLDEEDA